MRIQGKERRSGLRLGLWLSCPGKRAVVHRGWQAGSKKEKKTKFYCAPFQCEITPCISSLSKLRYHVGLYLDELCL